MQGRVLSLIACFQLKSFFSLFLSPFLIRLPSSEPTLRPLYSPSSSSARSNICWTWWNNCITGFYGSDYHQQLGMLAQGCKVTWIPIPITLRQLLLKESQLLTIMRSQNTQASFDCDFQPNQQRKETAVLEQSGTCAFLFWVEVMV